MQAPLSAQMPELIERYDTLLFDAYGVLVNREHTLPHATQLMKTFKSNQ